MGRPPRGGWQGVGAAHPRSRSFRSSFSSPGTPGLRSGLGARGLVDADQPGGGADGAEAPRRGRKAQRGARNPEGVPGRTRPRGRRPVARAWGCRTPGSAPPRPVSSSLSLRDAGSEAWVGAQSAWPCWEGPVPSAKTATQCLVPPAQARAYSPGTRGVAEGLTPLSTSLAAPWPKGKPCRQSPSRNGGAVLA